MTKIDTQPNAVAFILSTNDNSSLHALTAAVRQRRYNETFFGLMINTGCACSRTSGNAQFLQYSKRAQRNVIF